MFEHRLRFDLAAVIALADHTITSAVHATARGHDAAGPALLLVTGSTVRAGRDAVYLAGNSQPLPPTGGQPGTPAAPVVYAEAHDPAIAAVDRATTSGAGSGVRAVVPLCEPTAAPLIDHLRAAAAHGHHTFFTVTFTDCPIGVGTGRRRHRTPLPAAA